MYDFYRMVYNRVSEAPAFPKWVGAASPRQVERGMTLAQHQSSQSEKPCFVRLPDAQAVGTQAALLVARQLAEKPESSIVFPTGKTPLPMYAALRTMPDVDWSQSRLFQLDEYMPPAQAVPGVNAPSYETFAAFMERELWGTVAGRKYYIQDYLNNTQAYERLLTEGGGPDLLILGIGGNGHVAFNEPGSLPDSTMRVIDLEEQTIQSNFGQTGKSVPTQAMTLGLKNILQARRILLMATGTGKQEIVRRAFQPDVPPSVECPASWLKRHPCVTVMTDFEVESAFD
jgi:glucosamine-6-phosphate deaminase